MKAIVQFALVFIVMLINAVAASDGMPLNEVANVPMAGAFNGVTAFVLRHPILTTIGVLEVILGFPICKLVAFSGFLAMLPLLHRIAHRAIAILFNIRD